MEVRKIVSGGQTGVDRAALDPRKNCNSNARVVSGGNGLQRMDVFPTSIHYKKPQPPTKLTHGAECTRQRGTLILTWDRQLEARCIPSMRTAAEETLLRGLICSKIPVVNDVKHWCKDNQITVLNVAGPRRVRVPEVIGWHAIFAGVSCGLILVKR